MIEVFKFIGSAFIAAGFIFYIFNNAIKTSNFKRRGIFNLLLGLGLTVALLCGYLFDKYVERIIFSDLYYIYPSCVIIFTIAYTGFFLVKAKKYNHQFRGYKKGASRNGEYYLYILFKYEDYYLLNLENEKYRGYVVKFDRDIDFHDEMVKRVLRKMNLQEQKADHIGTIIVQKKQNIYFYCYCVELNRLNDNLETFTQINKYDIQNIDALDFDKNVILRIIIKEKFDIKI